MRNSLVKYVMLFALLFSLSSCLKNYTCVCESTDDFSGNVVSTREIEVSAPANNADEVCEENYSSGNGVTERCSLK